MLIQDFVVENHGSIWLLTPCTNRAREWVAEHLPDSAPTWGRAIAIGHQYAGPIINGIAHDGLTLEAA